MGAAREFTREELAGIAETFRRGRSVDKRDRAFFALGIGSAWRCGSLLSLTLGDAARREEGRWVARAWVHLAAANEKTGVARDYRLDGEVRRAVQEWVEEMGRMGAIFPGCALFCGVGAGRREWPAISRFAARRMVRRRFAEGCGLEGLDGVGVHSLRKTHCVEVKDFWEEQKAGGRLLDADTEGMKSSGHRSLESWKHYARRMKADSRLESWAAVERRAVRALCGAGGGGDGVRG
ncbi:MAG: hypothetical protein IK066_11715 [Kiritimatiellae bacterium]|nr:hypothetical protein [Kiritimatiellia bacterium]